MKAKQYPCALAETKMCKHGGNKYYNQGFVQGTASYCRKVKRWVWNLDKVCPLTEEKQHES